MHSKNELISLQKITTASCDFQFENQKRIEKYENKNISIICLRRKILHNQYQTTVFELQK